VPAEEVDRVAKSFAFHEEKISCSNQWMEIAAILKGFPRHLSQHVGGFVISRGPLAELVPVENAAMPERTVIQWDKDDLEALGLLKVDVLALGMLSAIPRCLGMIGKEMHEVPPEDPAVYDDPESRHHRRVPDRVTRADEHAAAAEAGELPTW
jgi:DNA polymerase III alpha subunit